jgi:hypothetical protein
MRLAAMSNTKEEAPQKKIPDERRGIQLAKHVPPTGGSQTMDEEAATQKRRRRSKSIPAVKPHGGNQEKTTPTA